MFTYFRMKRKEHRVKLALYTAIEALFTEKEDIIKLSKDLYVSLKDVPVEQLRDEFMGKLAEIIHKENHKDNNIAGETIDK